MTQQEIENLIKWYIQNHKHTGLDSLKVYQIQPSLTTKNTSALSSGGLYSLTSSDSVIIDNMRNRINDLETTLRKLTLLK